MSDTVNTGQEPVVTETDAPAADPSLQEDAGVPRAEREGLPPSYRMRADRHYVEQLVTRSAGHPVRMVPIADVESGEPFKEGDLRPLLESIRLHGIVHPLLVRRQGPRYTVVGGRRRLAAAHLLRLACVPCLVHDVDEAQAAALAAADNLTVAAAGGVPAGGIGLALALRRAAAQHLETVRTCTDLVSGGSSPTTRPMFDLIKAHAWRAARLLDALDLITNAPPPPGRDRRLSAIADEVIEGFGPEGRLNDFRIQARIADEASSSGLNDHALLAGLSAALLATLPLLDPAYQASVLVKAAPAGPGALVIEVTQAAAPVATELARRFFDEDTATLRPGGWSAVAGARAVAALAERYHGSATFDVGSHGGSTLRMELVRRS